MSDLLKRGDIMDPQTFHPLIFGYFLGKYDVRFQGLEIRKTGPTSYFVTAKFYHKIGEREVGYSDYIEGFTREGFRQSITRTVEGICQRYERMMSRPSRAKPKPRRAFDFNS